MDRLEYLDFELKIEKREQRYAVSVIRSPAGEAEGEFVSPFSDLELENLLLKLGRTRRGVRRIGSPEEQAARAFGGKLFEAVCKGDVRGCFRSSLDKAASEDKGLRIKLRLLDTPELADLPWEYLYNRPLNRFLSLSAQTPIVRYIELPEPIPPLAVKPPLHILVMVSSPSDYAQLDVEREKANLQSALINLEQRGMVKLEWLEEATLLALQRHLRRERYHIFHFIGHGGFDERAQDGLLLMKDEQGRGRAVSGQRLGVMLHDHPTLRLAVLNACEGARSSRTDPFAGTATTLVQQGIPAVVAMQSEITDEAAIVFASEFYAAIADGYPADASLAEARKAIFATGNDVEWGKPVLYMRSPDGQIFGVERISEEEREVLAKAAREAEERRQAQLAALYLEGKEALVAQDWQKAINKLNDVIALDASYKDARAKLTEAERQLELAREEERRQLEARERERARQEQLRSLYAEGIRATERSDWEAAIAAFKEVMIIDSKYRDAAARLDAAEAERKGAEEAQEREARLAELYAQAVKAKKAKNWAQVISACEEIRTIDRRYKDVASLLKQARAEEKRERRLASLYGQVVKAQDDQDWDTVIALCEEITATDPKYEDVAAILQEARRVKEAREREERLATLYGGAEAHHRKREWAQAVDLYGKVLALEPGYQDAEEKLAEAQRQQRLADQYAQALEHLQAERWQEAIEGFRTVVESDPTYMDATGLLAEAKRQKEIAGLPKPPAAEPTPRRGCKPTTLPK